MKRIVEERLVFEDGELMSGYEQDTTESAKVYIGFVLTPKRRFYHKKRRIRQIVYVPWELAMKWAMNLVRHAEEVRAIIRMDVEEKAGEGDDE